MTQLRLYQLYDVKKEEPLAGLFFHESVEARRMRAAFNKVQPKRYIVVPGPDHYNHKKP